MILIILLSLLLQLASTNSYHCKSDGKCYDDMDIWVYDCQYCATHHGEFCPIEANCVTCSSNPATKSHTFSLNAGGSDVQVEDHTTLFSPSSGCPAVGSCYGSGAVGISTSGSVSISVQTVGSGSASVVCPYGSVLDPATVSYQVQCGLNSTTIVTNTNTVSPQTVGLTPGSTPSFTFVPYTSSVSQCAIQRVPSDDATFTQSSHFTPSASGNFFEVVTAEQYLRRTLSFKIVFKADGGLMDHIDATLITKCVAASVPLGTYSQQTAYVGSGTVYYSATAVTPIITACTPIRYQVGTSSDSETLPSGLQQLPDPTPASFNVIPTDITARVTHSFYLWAILPDSAKSSAGPIELRVGCQNYIDPTISLTTSSTYTQQSLSFSGGVHSISLYVEDTNTGTAGQYRMAIDPFGSTVADCPATSIDSYVLTSSGSSIALPTALASLQAYTAGDASLYIDLNTMNKQLPSSFFFYLRAKDDETRWDNEAYSAKIEVTVQCGNEVISAASVTSPALVFAPLAAASINCLTDLVTKFLTTKAACPVTEFEFFSSATLSAPDLWSDPLISFTPAASPQPTSCTGAVSTTGPDKKSLYIKGVSETGKFASISLDVVVCGNEVINTINASPELYLQNATTPTVSTTLIPQTTWMSFFSIDASFNSHEDCKFGSVQLKADPGCSTMNPLSKLSLVGNDISLDYTNPWPPETAYLCLTSKGQKTAVKELTVEICGHESAYVVSGVEQLTLKFQKDSGPQGKRTFDFKNYNEVIKSTSTNCPLVNYTLALFHEGNQSYTDYSGTKAEMLSTFDIEISTSVAETWYLYVKGHAKSGQVEYLKLQIQIYEFMTDAFMSTINMPPFFSSAPEPLSLAGTEGEPLRTTIMLPKVLDSHMNFCGFFIDSEVGQYLASNSTELTEWKDVKASSQSSSFTYSFSSNSLVVVLPSDFIEQDKTTTVLKVTLIDDKEGAATYSISIALDISPKEDDRPETFLKPNVTSGALKAEISLDKFGELTVEFNESMKTYSFNISEIDSEVLDIYVEPLPSRRYEEGLDLSQLHLTWAVKEYEGTQLKIQLDWVNRLAVSPRVELDTLVFHIKDRGDFFISEESLTELPDDYLTMTTAIQRQIPRDSLHLGVEKASSIVSGTMMGATWTAFAANIFLSGVLNMMLGLINSLQLIIHLPVFNVAFPPNAFMVFESLIPLVTFDLLEAFEDEVEPYMSLFTSSVPEEATDEVAQQYQSVGFEDFRPVPNLGTLGLFIIIYLLKLLAFCISKGFTLLTKRGQRVTTALRSGLFFSEILLLFVEGSLDFCLASFLFLSWGFRSGAFNWIAFSFVGSISFILVPGALFWISKQPYQRFEDEEFCLKWGPLFEDIRTRDVGQRMFFLAFVLRRAAFAGIAFLFASTPSIQLLCLNLSNLGILIYQGYFKPISSKRRNFIEATNEVLICVASFHLMTFTDLEPSLEAKYVYGWSLVATVALFLLFNFGIILSLVGMAGINRLCLFYERYRRLREAEQALKRKDSEEFDELLSSDHSSETKEDEVVELSETEAFSTKPLSLGLSSMMLEREGSVFNHQIDIFSDKNSLQFNKSNSSGKLTKLKPVKGKRSYYQKVQSTPWVTTEQLKKKLESLKQNNQELKQNLKAMQQSPLGPSGNLRRVPSYQRKASPDALANQQSFNAARRENRDRPWRQPSPTSPRKKKLAKMVKRPINIGEGLTPGEVDTQRAMSPEFTPAKAKKAKTGKKKKKKTFKKRKTSPASPEKKLSPRKKTTSVSKTSPRRKQSPSKNRTVAAQEAGSEPRNFNFPEKVELSTYIHADLEPIHSQREEERKVSPPRQANHASSEILRLERKKLIRSLTKPGKAPAQPSIDDALFHSLEQPVSSASKSQLSSEDHEASPGRLQRVHHSSLEHERVPNQMPFPAALNPAVRPSKKKKRKPWLREYYQSRPENEPSGFRF